MFPSNYPYYRCLFAAVCRHYDTEKVIEELIKMGWKPDAIKLTPEIVERSIEGMMNLILHGETSQ
jgi:hypothetical protein